MSVLPMIPMMFFALVLAGSLLGSVLSYALDRMYGASGDVAPETDYRKIFSSAYGMSEEDRIRPSRVTYRASEARSRLELAAV